MITRRRVARFYVTGSIILWGMCGVCTVQTVVLAQSETARRPNIVAVSPIILQLYPNVRFWRFLTPTFALGGGVHVPWSIFGSKRLTGYGAMVEPRYYIALTKRADWYAAANVSFGFIRHVDTVAAPYSMLGTVGVDIFTDSARQFTIGLGISAGYIWNVTQIHAYSGQNFNEDVYSSNGHVFGLGVNSWISAARLDIGWAW